MIFYSNRAMFSEDIQKAIYVLYSLPKEIWWNYVKIIAEMGNFREMMFEVLFINGYDYRFKKMNTSASLVVVLESINLYINKLRIDHFKNLFDTFISQYIYKYSTDTSVKYIERVKREFQLWAISSKVVNSKDSIVFSDSRDIYTNLGIKEERVEFYSSNYEECKELYIYCSNELYSTPESSISEETDYDDDDDDYDYYFGCDYGHGYNCEYSISEETDYDDDNDYDYDYDDESEESEELDESDEYEDYELFIADDFHVCGIPPRKGL